ncbi:Hypothetical_protein [Hexamita inflata]|uniref:Hypothetical_protein n=1 Tax=Hexamita inflata TaxID=28002 RepID=A0AA86UES9_9EUKA|nr:Hypothetical protein HINF_LOCUS40529 [Hexamita inflata]
MQLFQSTKSTRFSDINVIQQHDSQYIGHWTWQNLAKRLLDTLAYILWKSRKSIHDYRTSIRYFEISHVKTQLNFMQALSAHFYLMIGIGVKNKCKNILIACNYHDSAQHEELT